MVRYAVTGAPETPRTPALGGSSHAAKQMFGFFAQDPQRQAGFADQQTGPHDQSTDAQHAANQAEPQREVTEQISFGKHEHGPQQRDQAGSGKRTDRQVERRQGADQQQRPALGNMQLAEAELRLGLVVVSRPSSSRDKARTRSIARAKRFEVPKPHDRRGVGQNGRGGDEGQDCERVGIESSQIRTLAIGIQLLVSQLQWSSNSSSDQSRYTRPSRSVSAQSSGPCMRICEPIGNFHLPWPR